MADQGAALRQRKPPATNTPSSPPNPRKNPTGQAKQNASSSSAAAAAAATPPTAPHLEVREPTWLDPGTWSASTRFLPAYFALAAIFLALYIFRDSDALSASAPEETPLDSSTPALCAATFNHTFAINSALDALRANAVSGAEIGLTAAAAHEVFTGGAGPALFGGSGGGLAGAFPHGKLPVLSGFAKLSPAMLYVDQRVSFYGGRVLLKRAPDGVVEREPTGMDAVALGVPGVMLAERRTGAKAMVDWLAGELLLSRAGGSAPRFANGALGWLGREPAEVWAEAVALWAPFLAYYAVLAGEVGVLREVVEQIGLYREVLLVRGGAAKGAWRHVAGPAAVADEGVWATGNALAAWGMLWARATIEAWAPGNATLVEEKGELEVWIREILDAAIKNDDDGSGLLRNYLDDKSWFGESSGTSLMAAVAYRMAVINPGTFATEKYLSWAHRKRQSVYSRVGEDGIAKPAIDPLKYQSRETVDVSVQGQAFLALLGVAWKDCVCAGVCLDVYFQEHPQPEVVRQEMPWNLMYEYFSEKLKYFRGPGQ